MSSDKVFECKYCKNPYADATTLSKHKNYYCKFIPDDVKAKLLEKQQKRKKNTMENADVVQEG